jgi:hypothetical protein
MKLVIRAGLRERRDTRDKLNALIDAQVRTEEAMARLADSQAHSDRRLDALIDVVKDKLDGKG